MESKELNWLCKHMMKNVRSRQPVFHWMSSVKQKFFHVSIVNKDKGDESLSLPALWRHVVNVIFLKYSKEGRSSSSHLGIRSTPSYVCCDDTKHYQVQSEHRRIQNSFNYLRGVFLHKQLTASRRSLDTQKNSLRCLKGFWIHICWRQV